MEGVGVICIGQIDVDIGFDENIIENFSSYKEREARICAVNTIQCLNSISIGNIGNAILFGIGIGCGKIDLGFGRVNRQILISNSGSQGRR